MVVQKVTGKERQWRQRVIEQIDKHTEGLLGEEFTTQYDIGDMGAWFEEGVTPKTAALMILEDSGFLEFKF